MVASTWLRLIGSNDERSISLYISTHLYDQMVSSTQKHILFHSISLWGHHKPILPFAMQIIHSRPNIVISVLTCADVYAKAMVDIEKLPDDLKTDAKARFHVIDICGCPINALLPLLEFEPNLKAIYNGESIKCLSSGKTYQLPPITIAVLDPFAGYAVEAIREISENKTPYLFWVTVNAGSCFGFFRETPSGKLDLRTIRYGREQDIMPRLSEFVEPLPIMGNTFVDHARTYLASGRGMFILSSTPYDGEVIDATKEWFSSLGQVAYPVGPALLPDSPSALSVTSTRDNIKPVVKFLDRMQKEHGEKSVVYMSFGTFFWPQNPEKVWAVIKQLLASGTPLVWAHPSPLCVVPDDKLKMFQESDIAFEIKWAPQEEILSHPATGWFISHGGWNSIQEAMQYQVPQIFWPISADQPVNAATMTLVKKAGFELIEVRTGEYGTRKMYRFKDLDPKDLPTFTVDAVRREIRDLVVKLKGEEGLTVRKNFEKMSRGFMSVWNERGEARQSLDAFLEKFID
ncbi:hypothetical protein D9758_003101 [Tetrapyrgos nigripes]|uniref:UDP-Glycosyltransferase/glycogen phosphorylase n=1 Tax=Tetrapyrgos nigripes TaxID=182062 RepID=A0A8H5LSZ4_9AGAR|nr:hypothetical protein D9758_003101 [Tetrapyrgos nigripes]